MNSFANAMLECTVTIQLLYWVVYLVSLAFAVLHTIACVPCAVAGLHGEPRGTAELLGQLRLDDNLDFAGNYFK